MLDRELFISAMRNVATPVTIVTTNGPAGAHGATVSAMCSLSADPASLLICLNRQSRILGLIEENGAFCVNVIAEGQDDIAMAFAGAPRTTPRKFATPDWTHDNPNNLPELRNAAATFQCAYKTTQSFGSHQIIVGTVLATTAADHAPLVYHQGSFFALATNRAKPPRSEPV
jgi:flavin reductase